MKLIKILCQKFSKLIKYISDKLLRKKRQTYGEISMTFEVKCLFVSFKIYCIFSYNKLHPFSLSLSSLSPFHAPSS